LLELKKCRLAIKHIKLIVVVEHIRHIIVVNKVIIRSKIKQVVVVIKQLAMQLRVIIQQFVEIKMGSIVNTIPMVLIVLVVLVVIIVVPMISK